MEQQGVLAESEPTRVHDTDGGHQRNRSSAPTTPSARWHRGRPAVRPLSNAGESKSTSFSAYRSPLTSFPSYRYNEQFDGEAKAGYRSLTYSNSIDPKVPLCPTELS